MGKDFQVRGTIGTVSCRKTGTMGMWSITVEAELIPGAGEQVQQMSAFVEVKDAGGLVLGNSVLMHGAGNTYTASTMVPSEPHSVTVKCRFVSDVMQKTENCH